MKSFISHYHPESLHSVFHHHDTGERPVLSKHPENVSQEEKGERKKKKPFRPEAHISQRTHIFPLWLCFCPPAKYLGFADNSLPQMLFKQ